MVAHTLQQRCCWAQVRARPLPCVGAQPGVVYDLHAAHAESGATDEAAFPFVPPQWRPFNEGVPQIPGTFPVHATPRTCDTLSTWDILALAVGMLASASLCSC